MASVVEFIENMNANWFAIIGIIVAVIIAFVAPSVIKKKKNSFKNSGDVFYSERNMNVKKKDEK